MTIAVAVAAVAVVVIVVAAPSDTTREPDGVESASPVESTAPLWDADTAWRIASDPVLDIAEAGTGPAYEFVQVRDVLRLTNGQLVVGDGGSQEVRVYDADGSLVRVLGGAGDGPGEFQGLGRLVALPGGRVAAVDLARGGRGAVFDAEIGLVETFRLPADAFPVRHPVPSDGAIWGVVQPAFHREPGLHRPPVQVVRLAAGFARADTLLTIDGNETFITPTADAIPVMGRRTHVVPGHGDEVIVGTADRLEFQRIDAATGRTVSAARILGVSLSVSRREAERELEARLGPSPSPVASEIMTGLPLPDRRPAYEHLLVDAENNVWAGEFLGMLRRDEARKWYVWDATGTWLGVVETPERFDLMRVGVEEVLGVRRDVNDVERPQVLRLVKPGG